MSTKTKSYPFSKEGLERLKFDERMNKISTVIDIIFYGGMIILLAKGVIGKNYILEYAVGTGTSKVVKFLMKH